MTSRTSFPKRKKVLLPLLQALKSLKPEFRIIILAHLDDKTRDGIYETITYLLRDKNIPEVVRRKIKLKLQGHKEDLRFLTDKKKDANKKKRRLTQVGGGPMTLMLKHAIPLMLNLYS